jgi:hypothetical protein
MRLELPNAADSARLPYDFHSFFTYSSYSGPKLRWPVRHKLSQIGPG